MSHQRQLKSVHVLLPTYLRIRKLAAKQRKPLWEFCEELAKEALDRRYGKEEEDLEPPPEFQHLFTQEQ